MCALDPTSIKAICFDVDGTLCDTDDQWVDILSRFSTPLGMFLPQAAIITASRAAAMKLMAAGNQAHHLLDKLDLDDDFERLTGMFSTGADTARRWQFSIIAGVQDMLAELRPQFPLAVVSSRGNDSTLAFLDQFDIARYFEVVVTSQTTALAKPHPQPLLHAAERLQVRPEELLMVGDTTFDILAARAAGCQSIGVLSGFGYAHELHTAGAALVIESVAELPTVLRF